MDFAWRVVPFEEVRQFVTTRPGAPSIVAIDGRSASGKTTLAGRLAAAVPGAAVVHTDDIAWHQAVLDWTDLLVEGVLRPVRAGRPVRYRPPQWDRLGRPGAVEVPDGAPLVLVEGVGAGRRDLAAWYDAVIWVETDPGLTTRRDGARVAAGETTPAIYGAWMAEENPFVERERTWERADLVVNGSGTVPHDPATEVVVA
ncbi:MAG TPA: hypothetical protein VFH03_04075 [Actinoplanes sp.]|nr:hypothetical protein [Actinoplanes sp.]